MGQKVLVMVNLSIQDLFSLSVNLVRMNGGNRIQVFRKSGEFISKWGKKGREKVNSNHQTVYFRKSVTNIMKTCLTHQKTK